MEVTITSNHSIRSGICCAWKAVIDSFEAKVHYRGGRLWRGATFGSRLFHYVSVPFAMLVLGERADALMRQSSGTIHRV